MNLIRDDTVYNNLFFGSKKNFMKSFLEKQQDE